MEDISNPDEKLKETSPNDFPHQKSPKAKGPYLCTSVSVSQLHLLASPLATM